MGTDALIAYCGPAAAPQDVWTRWNFDPLLIAALAVLALAIACGRSDNARAGWLTAGAIPLSSPGHLLPSVGSLEMNPVTRLATKR